MPNQYEKPQGISVALAVTDPSDAERKFKALSEGGNVTMPIQQTFWAKRFGMVTDKFGIPYEDAAALYAQAAALPGIEPVGLATHIGSQILGLAPFRDAYARIADLVVAVSQHATPVIQIRQHALTFQQRAPPQVPAIHMQQIEEEELQSAVLAGRQRRLQRGKA